MRSYYYAGGVERIMIRTHRQLLASLFLFAIGSQAAMSVTLIQHTFDATANDTGPAWAEYTWGNQTGALTDVNNGIVHLHDFNHYRAGLSTTSTVDASSAAGFTLSWTITSSNITSAAVTEAGWFFGVSTAVNGSNNLWDDSPGFSFGVLMSSADFSDWVVVDHSDTSVETQHAMAGTIPSDASMQDGFTLSITLNSDDTWEVTTTGLSNTQTSTGSLSANVTYADLAGSLLATTNLQGANLTYTIDQMSLSTIPEPSAAILAGLGSLLLLHRRR